MGQKYINVFVKDLRDISDEVDKAIEKYDVSGFDVDHRYVGAMLHFIVTERQDESPENYLVGVIALFLFVIEVLGLLFRRRS